MPTPFAWILRPGHADEWPAMVRLVSQQAVISGARLSVASDPRQGRRLRAELPDEEVGQEFWLAVHEAADELSLAVELVTDPAGAGGPWSPLDDAGANVEAEPGADEGGAGISPAAASAPAAAATAVPGLTRFRPEVPEETLYDLLREQDPDLDGKLDQTIQQIEAEGLPVVHLLPYLDLPLFQEYAGANPGEREQNLFLHMLHTWTCYRRFGAVHARLGPELAATLSDSRWLRLHSTQFQSPAPALCVQFPAWWQTLRAPGGGPAQWVKEVYLIHCEPPTPLEDRELTLMIVTHDERGEFGFVPLEIPLSLPAVDESLQAFFAPSLEDEDLGANTQDLQQTCCITAAWCLYSCARDPVRYLGSASPPGAE